jgi:GNAT superfamily N-acetyltransferase
MGDAITIRKLSADEAEAAVPALTDVLMDCVVGGASVSFMAGVSRERLAGFWREVANAVRADGRVLLVAEADGAIVGTVQLVPCAIDNQPHRADVAKMLVSRSARGAGVGARLMAAVEAEARAIGRSLLTLDTVTDSAGERLYRRMGWTFVGVIPDYALFPDGAPTAATIFYKTL